MPARAGVPPTARRLSSRLVAWFGEHARDLPWRRTRDPYAIWISEIMLQQTQVKTVIPYWERWMRALPTVAALARAPWENVLKLWEGLGYYTRARNLQRAAELIRRQHRGEFPRELDAVLALPGIGRYTAGAICSIAFGQPAPILDGNVTRVLARLGAIRDDVRSARVQRRLWALAEDLVRTAPGRCSELNQALMELGATICTPRNPQCGECPIRSDCRARRVGRAESFPRRVARPATTARRAIAFVVERGGRVLLRQRPTGVVNAHLWEFPTIEDAAAHVTPETAAATLFRSDRGQVTPWKTWRHSITRYRITLEVHGMATDAPPRVPGGRWVSPAKLAELAMPAAHRKIAVKWWAGKARAT
jgi:A/G-specific adenine glycosylase